MTSTMPDGQLQLNPDGTPRQLNPVNTSTRTLDSSMTPNMTADQGGNLLTSKLLTAVNNMDPANDQKTIMDQYATRQANAQASGSANRTLISNQYDPQISEAQRVGDVNKTAIDESTNGLGPASKLAILSQADADTRKKVKDLTMQRDSALANNDAATASRVDNLILQEQQSVSDAKKNFLDTIFNTSSLLKNEALQDRYASQADAQTNNYNLANSKNQMDFVAQNGITQPLYKVGNTYYDTATGQPKYKLNGSTVETYDGSQKFSTPQEFFQHAGINSWDQIDDKALTSKSSSSSNVLSEVGGHRVLLDKSTGTVVQDLGPVKGSGGAKPSTARQLTDAQNQIDQYLTPRRGTDGFVSPSDYTAARSAWIQDGFPVSTFDSKFGKYINPADPQDYAGGKAKQSKPAKTSTKSTINIQ